MAMKGHKPPKATKPAAQQDGGKGYVTQLNNLQRDLPPLLDSGVSSGTTGVITIPTWAAGGWITHDVDHGLGRRPLGFTGFLVADGSPSVVSGIPVCPNFADSNAVLRFVLCNTTAGSLSGQTINLAWVAWL